MPDFFNNVAAVAVVIMFTKAVTHRTRSRPPVRPVALSTWHVVGVCVAVASAVVALIATATGRDSEVFYVLAWATLMLAGATLIADEYLEMRRVHATARSNQVSPPTEP